MFVSAFLRFIVTGGMLERTAFLCFVISHVVVTSVVDGVAAFRAAWYKAASKPITFYIAADI